MRRSKGIGQMNRTVYETQYDPEHSRRTLETLARGIFYFGALTSALDGFLTWLVVRNTGTNIERNSFMGWFMIHIGLVPTVLVRIAIGVLCFWYVANLLVGRRIFLRSSRAAKYVKWVTKTDRPGYQQRFMAARPYITAMETVFILVITSVVVGNNVNAAIVYFHNTHA